MGVNLHHDISQENMSSLLFSLGFVCLYLDYLLIISTGSFEEQLQHVVSILQQLRIVGLPKSHSFYDQTEIT